LGFTAERGAKKKGGSERLNEGAVGSFLFPAEALLHLWVEMKSGQKKALGEGGFAKQGSLGLNMGWLASFGAFWARIGGFSIF
jgi:hypothetical protein